MSSQKRNVKIEEIATKKNSDSTRVEKKSVKPKNVIASITKPVYFDAEKLGPPVDSLVCWIDTMGSKNKMSNSIQVAANHIFKIHCAILEAYEKLSGGFNGKVKIYPMMDGAFITFRSRHDLELMLREVFVHLAVSFVSESEDWHKFMVRAGISFGLVYHGSDIQIGSNNVLDKHPNVKDCVILGLPMLLAVEAEGNASPFGIAIDRSARAMSLPNDKAFEFSWFRWQKNTGSHNDNLDKLPTALLKYMEWNKKHYLESGYALARIEEHEEMIKQYFGL